MINVLLHRCCEAQIKSCCKKGDHIFEKGLHIYVVCTSSRITKLFRWNEVLMRASIWATAGLDVQYEPTKKYNLRTNHKGYDKSETTDEKLSARRIQIYLVYFSVIII